jgi:hypothetical protein
MAGERVRGLAAAFSLFDALPDAARDELSADLREIAADVLAAQRRDVAVATGGLRDKALTIKDVVDKLRIRIGVLGLTGGRVKYYYARFVEYGRRAQVVRVTRRRKGAPKLLKNGRKRAQDVGASYALHVKAMAARPFVRKDRPDLDTAITSRLANFWSRTLSKAGAD